MPHAWPTRCDDRPSISIHVYGANIGAVRRHVFDAATGAVEGLRLGLLDSDGAQPVGPLRRACGAAMLSTHATGVATRLAGPAGARQRACRADAGRGAARPRRRGARRHRAVHTLRAARRAAGTSAPGFDLSDLEPRRDATLRARFVRSRRCCRRCGTRRCAPWRSPRARLGRGRRPLRRPATCAPARRTHASAFPAAPSASCSARGGWPSWSAGTARAPLVTEGATHDAAAALAAGLATDVVEGDIDAWLAATLRAARGRPRDAGGGPRGHPARPPRARTWPRWTRARRVPGLVERIERYRAGAEEVAARRAQAGRRAMKVRKRFTLSPGAGNPRRCRAGPPSPRRARRSPPA